LPLLTCSSFLCSNPSVGWFHNVGGVHISLIHLRHTLVCWKHLSIADGFLLYLFVSNLLIVAILGAYNDAFSTVYLMILYKKVWRDIHNSTIKPILEMMYLLLGIAIVKRSI
jgi:hypothetical protein